MGMPTDLQGDAVSREDAALLKLVGLLRDYGYRFTPVTPSTQARVNQRPGNSRAFDLVGVFGWSRPFRKDLLPGPILALMHDADVLAEDNGDLRSRIRVSTLGTQFFVHSAYPTIHAHSVFFGPDTVRFVQAIGRHLKERAAPPRCVADIGCGAGPGGVFVSASVPGAEVLMLDINAMALRYARVNAAVNSVTARAAYSDVLTNTSGCFDLIVSNPPYLIDQKGRTYRHGGGRFGEGLSLEILSQSLSRLSEGGTLLLYTGTAVIAGQDVFAAGCGDLLEPARLHWSYTEIDPDVFGEELDEPAYADADRIAAVLLTVTNAHPS